METAVAPVSLSSFAIRHGHARNVGLTVFPAVLFSYRLE